MQTTLLGLAIAFIIALVAALVGPYFIDWNQFRPQFEAEASRIIGTPVRVAGKLDARLLPAPSLQLRSVVVGGANDLGKVRADKLDVEFSLGSLMRGEVRATELTINGMSLDLGLDPKGRIDWPASTGTLNLGSLAIDRLNLTGRIALHDAASRSTLELSDIAFSGDVRSLAGSIRGDGNFVLSGTRYPFRVSSGQTADGNGTRVHLNIDPGPKTLSADLDGVLSFDARAPRFEGAMILASPPRQKGSDFDTSPPPWRVTSRVKADYSAARLEALEVTYGADERALKLAGNGDMRFGASPLLRASLSARQLDADRFFAKDSKDARAAEPVRVLPAVRALMSGMPQVPIPAQIELASEQVMLGGRPLQDIAAELHGDAKSWSVRKLDFRAPGTTRVSLSGATAKGASPDQFKAALNVEFFGSRRADDLAAGPRRHRLSQPEAAAAARRRHHCAGRIFHRCDEGRDRWRRRRRPRRGLAPGRQHRLENICAVESRAARPRCGHRVCALAGGPAGRVAGRRAARRWISAAPFRPARSCGRWWPGLAMARRFSRSTS